jgi:uncharacterized integral membrane protein (TIGR00698 family)
VTLADRDSTVAEVGRQVSEGSRGAEPARLAAGLALCTMVAAAGWGLSRALGAAGRVSPDAVVLAILLGLLLRALWHPRATFAPGLAFAERRVLEVAIVFLGASTDLRWIVRAGPLLVGAVVMAVATALVVGLGAGRWIGLSRNHALLVASGNAICGNSAIAAVATLVDARQEESASAITFTALLSLAIVLVLPLAAAMLGLNDEQFGVLAGLTVYSVPQVLAATFPVSAEAGEVATLVKLIRVLLLIPLLLVIAHTQRRALRPAGRYASSVFPVYIRLFLVVALLRTAGLLPGFAIVPAQAVSHAFTVVAMAALGLSVDVRRLRDVGWPAIGAACASLAALALVALAIAMLLV